MSKIYRFKKIHIKKHIAAFCQSTEWRDESKESSTEIFALSKTGYENALKSNVENRLLKIFKSPFLLIQSKSTARGILKSLLFL